MRGDEKLVVGGVDLEVDLRREEGGAHTRDLRMAVHRTQRRAVQEGIPPVTDVARGKRGCQFTFGPVCEEALPSEMTASPAKRRPRPTLETRLLLMFAPGCVACSMSKAAVCASYWPGPGMPSWHFGIWEAMRSTLDWKEAVGRLPCPS